MYIWTAIDVDDRKLDSMLRLGNSEDLLLPSVAGLLTNAVLLAPVFYIATAVPTFLNPPGPQSQFVLLIDCL